MTSNMFIIESKATDGRYGLPNKWMSETLPLEEAKAIKTLGEREKKVSSYDGVDNFEYRLVELEEVKPKKKKKKKVKKKS
tara:strand:- start:460 stop:699 length:240 start_codon:yes stop_codon:yes gene_type:complete